MVYGAFYSDPMPGENKERGGENKESEEGAENQNPYWNPGFEHLEDGGEDGTGEEEPTIPETEPQLQQVQAESAAEEPEDNTPPTGDDEKPDNAVTDTFTNEWEKGTAGVSIQDQQQHIEQAYTDGAVQQAADLLAPTTTEAIQHANTEFGDSDEQSAQQREDQEIKNVAGTITAQAMLVNQEASATSEAIALGADDEAEHAAKLEQAQATVDQLASAGDIAVQDASSPEIQARTKETLAEARAIVDAATEQVEQTRANVEAAQQEAQDAADEAAEAEGKEKVDLSFEDLDEKLDDDQKETIIDAMVADNPNMPKHE